MFDGLNRLQHNTTQSITRIDDLHFEEGVGHEEEGYGGVVLEAAQLEVDVHASDLCITNCDISVSADKNKCC